METLASSRSWLRARIGFSVCITVIFGLVSLLGVVAALLREGEASLLLGVRLVRLL